jgi:hypothetical protein
MDVVAITYHPIYMGWVNRRFMIQTRPCIKKEPISKMVKAKGLAMWLKD